MSLLRPVLPAAAATSSEEQTGLTMGRKFRGGGAGRGDVFGAAAFVKAERGHTRHANSNVTWSRALDHPGLQP